MTRRVLATLTFALVTGGFVATATSASAYDESTICLGGKNQSRPGSYQGICLENIIQVGDLP